MKPSMETERSVVEAQDVQARKKSGWLTAIAVFIAAYAIFILGYDHLGLALGWLPSTIVSAASGWIAYQFPWIGDVVAVLLELVAALIC